MPYNICNPDIVNRVVQASSHTGNTVLRKSPTFFYGNFILGVWRWGRTRFLVGVGRKNVYIVCCHSFEERFSCDYFLKISKHIYLAFNTFCLYFYSQLILH